MVVSLREEVGSAEFGDKRLDKRLGLIVKQFGAKPNLSIPAATDSRAEMEGAYRFFDNDKVTPETSFNRTSIRRGRGFPSRFRTVGARYFGHQLDSPDRQVTGAGPMDSETRRGCCIHSWRSLWTDCRWARFGKKRGLALDRNRALGTREKSKTRTHAH